MPPPLPLSFKRLPETEMRERSATFCEELRARRSVRHFSDEPIPLNVVRSCIETAAQAPSGANKQPWTFVMVSDPEIKRQIRQRAEAEEQAFYGGRAPQRWLEDLAALGTDANKSFLEQAPVLIVLFAERHGRSAEERTYYVNESVGIATGFLIAALHHAGLATLTHTPSPLGFLTAILKRPPAERPFLLLPVGYPAADCQVPDIRRKALSDVLVEC